MSEMSYCCADESMDTMLEASHYSAASQSGPVQACSICNNTQVEGEALLGMGAVYIINSSAVGADRSNREDATVSGKF